MFIAAWYLLMIIVGLDLRFYFEVLLFKSARLQLWFRGSWLKVPRGVITTYMFSLRLNERSRIWFSEFTSFAYSTAGEFLCVEKLTFTIQFPTCLCFFYRSVINAKDEQNLRHISLECASQNFCLPEFWQIFGFVVFVVKRMWICKCFVLLDMWSIFWDSRNSFENIGLLVNTIIVTDQIFLSSSHRHWLIV